jgi:hypothetical protein
MAMGRVSRTPTVAHNRTSCSHPPADAFFLRCQTRRVRHQGKLYWLFALANDLPPVDAARKTLLQLGFADPAIAAGFLVALRIGRLTRLRADAGLGAGRRRGQASAHREKGGKGRHGDRPGQSPLCCPDPKHVPHLLLAASLLVAGPLVAGKPAVPSTCDHTTSRALVGASVPVPKFASTASFAQ